MIGSNREREKKTDCKRNYIKSVWLRNLLVIPFNAISLFRLLTEPKFIFSQNFPFYPWSSSHFMVLKTVFVRVSQYFSNSISLSLPWTFSAFATFSSLLCSIFSLNSFYSKLSRWHITTNLHTFFQTRLLCSMLLTFCTFIRLFCLAFQIFFQFFLLLFFVFFFFLLLINHSLDPCSYFSISLPFSLSHCWWFFHSFYLFFFFKVPQILSLTYFLTEDLFLQRIPVFSSSPRAMSITFQIA